MSKTPTRVRDPRQVPVQLNVSVRWSFREFLINEASRRNVSLAALINDTLMKEFGKAYLAEETERNRDLTSEAGATR